MNQNKTFTSDRTLFYGPTETVDERPVRIGKNISEVTAMVIDCGLFVEMARTLGRSYKKVYYCVPSWVMPFPKMQFTFIGHGFDEIEVCLSPFDHFDDIDLYIFPDVGHGAMQEHLVSTGKAVWGSKTFGENLEFYRDDTKELLQSLNLPVGKYEVVKGVDALRTYLKAAKNTIWVKINIFRGNFETFKCEDYKIIEPRIDELEYRLGKFAAEVEFVCEDSIEDAFEVAGDAYNIDGQLPKKFLYGVEIKNEAYAGMFSDYKNFPDVIKMFDTKMAPLLKKNKYRSFYSPETRISTDKKPYMVDMCSRAPSPPNELYQIFYKNLAEIIWEGANGNCIDPVSAAQWGAEIMISSPFAMDNWTPIYIPKEYEQFVKIRNATFIDGKKYFMPQVGNMAEMGGVVGYGDSMKSAMDMAKKIADSVAAHELCVPGHALEKAEKEIATAKERKIWLKNE